MRYLLIHVDFKGIHVAEYQCDQPDDTCEYCQTFEAWTHFFEECGQFLDGYGYVSIRGEK